MPTDYEKLIECIAEEFAPYLAPLSWDDCMAKARKIAASVEAISTLLKERDALTERLNTASALVRELNKP
jgi:hypothetical protein